MLRRELGHIDFIIFIDVKHFAHALPWLLQLHFYSVIRVLLMNLRQEWVELAHTFSNRLFPSKTSLLLYLTLTQRLLLDNGHKMSLDQAQIIIKLECQVAHQKPLDPPHKVCRNVLKQKVLLFVPLSRFMMQILIQWHELQFLLENLSKAFARLLLDHFKQLPTQSENAVILLRQGLHASLQIPAVPIAKPQLP